MDWTGDELARLGGELGSDVPFFFHTPAAWCTGRGEVVTPVALGRPLDFVIAKPAVGLSTAEVYRGVTIPERPETGEEMRRAVAAGDVEEIGRRLHNRLQEAAERLRPEIAAGLDAPAGAGAGRRDDERQRDEPVRPVPRPGRGPADRPRA